MNKLVLLGRLVNDPVVRYTQTGKVVAQFTLAVNRPYTSEGGQREADFINCVLWGKPAETLGNHVTKGQRVLVEGRLQIRSYNAQDGSKRYVTEVICNSFEFIESKNNGETSGQQQSAMDSFGSAVPFDPEIPF